ncbi:hypothetical protein Ms3S1_16840 [Methylosinus sp. 3S-1]|uniref:Uncharacterized protein n=2 Tax=Methylocystaceae TaxID=31993 RepID=A0A2D2CYW0_METT3|nr:hypothetical protein CQW49_08470 [Methylosinus trichosporium OB3b]OBS54009.1 hypothetical protein A8B73_02845 [Methylosinus sp. 3S-1]
MSKPSSTPTPPQTIAPPPGPSLTEALRRLADEFEDSRRSASPDVAARRDDLEAVAQAIADADDLGAIGPGERLQIDSALADVRERGGSHAVLSKTTLAAIFATFPLPLAA